jgi:integrase
LTLDEIARRNYTEGTTRAYLRIIEDFARYFHRPPDQLGPEQIREYTAHLFRDRKLSDNTVNQMVGALRFFFLKTLKRPWSGDEMPYPKKRIHLPVIWSPEEVACLIDAAPIPFYRTILITLYGTGVRRAELADLKGTDVDAARMVLHVQNGKGGKDRDIVLSPHLLDELRPLSPTGPQTFRLAVPWRPLAYRRLPHQRQGRLARLPGSRPARRCQQAAPSAHASPLLRHTSAGRRRRLAYHSTAPRPRRPAGDDDLPPSLQAPRRGHG